jgi:RimJ/RimL family protein N-acetyltransferase
VTISIVRFESHHLHRFEAMIDDPDVVRYTPMPSPVPDGFGPAWLGRYESGRADGTREAFAIVEDEEFLGIAVAPSINATAREAELGYLVAPWARRRGAASTALRLLTRWAFEDKGFLRAYLRINVGNTASVAVARRCGYTYEGTLRSTWFKGDLRVDTEIWSRLPSDPTPV